MILANAGGYKTLIIESRAYYNKIRSLIKANLYNSWVQQYE